MIGPGWWSYIHQDEQAAQQSIDRSVLRRVAAYARPYLGRIVLMLLTILAITGMTLVPPLLMRALIDEALPNRDLTQLNLLAAGMVLVPLANGLVGVLQRYISSQIGEGIIYDLRRAVFDHLQRQSLRFFTNSKTGELMARVNNDVVGAQGAITNTVPSLISNTLALVGTLSIMLALEWRLTLLGIAILPLFILPARRVGSLLRRITREGMTLNAQMNGMMNETLNVSGALLVKLFGRQGDESRRFGERAVAIRDIGIRQALIGRWFFLGIGLVSSIGTAMVFWTGGYLVLTDALTIGTVVAFGAYLTQLYGPIAALTNARVELVTSLVSFERVFEVLDLPLEIEERPDAVDLGQVRGEIRFEHVSFSYLAPGAGVELSAVQRWGWRDLAPPSSNGRVPGSATKRDKTPTGVMGQGAVEKGAVEKGAMNRAPTGSPDMVGAQFIAPAADLSSSVPPGGGDEGTDDGGLRWALRDVSFAARPGQITALVGPSGAGKTTITYLLPRLYDPTEGRVTIDDHDLRDVTLSSLVAQIGMVTQETHLFHDTIRANLLYARSAATQDEIEAACRAANIHDFIVSLPDGYETIVGERGYRLSGGEKQRLAIARVLLKDPGILVLDEATAHLDSQAEVLIQQALEVAMRGRTSLVIAHRLSTILAADQILVLDGGQIVERGTHAELLAAGGLYARLYETQFRPSPVGVEERGQVSGRTRDRP
ncbi:MAG TPA: ABC transporter ATP-binding protein [Chloroflexota bacterium]|nr:ABC transporter ATP-binding protein [Chloroflexota bacterium]